MKKLVLLLMFGSLFIGCATKAVNNTEPSEPKEQIEPIEPAEGIMPAMPVRPQFPDVIMPQMPDRTESQKGRNMFINQVVETACGQCQFGMREKAGCDLAVHIDGKHYFVDGTNIDGHGDPHAEDGFCQTIRRASVTGEIIDDQFKAESFTLIK